MVPFHVTAVHAYAVLGVLFAIVAIARTPWAKGWFGELQVNWAIKALLRGGEYHATADVTLPTQDRTAQIDHVIVSKYGIFVIETKNRNGRIYGKEHERNWTQKLHPRHSQSFPNPLHQNYGHVKVLAETLSLPENVFRPVVIFVGANTEFKTDMPPNVTMTRQGIEYVRGHRDVLLSDEQVEAALARIAEARLAPGFRTHREHVRNVQSRHKPS
jgi:restriction system protein